MSAEPRVRVNLQPIATPLPLTFAGLLIGSALVSGKELGWIPVSEQHALGWVLVVLPLPLQLLAAWWGFVARSAAAATGAGVLAAVWIGSGLDLVNGSPRRVPSHVVGMLLIAAAAALLVPALAEISTGNLLAAGVLALAAVRFVLTGASGIAQSTGWGDAAGVVGLVVAAAALYAALAFELEAASGAAVVPVLRVGRARRLLHAPLEQQTERLAHEPGVRRVL